MNSKVSQEEKNRIKNSMKGGTAELIDAAKSGKSLMPTELQAALIRVYSPKEQEPN